MLSSEQKSNLTRNSFPSEHRQREHNYKVQQRGDIGEHNKLPVNR